MTVQELVDYCNREGVSLDTQIVLRTKDDYFLTEEKVSTSDYAYFGNCSEGQDWERNSAPKNENGEPDWDNWKMPELLILSGIG